MSKRSGVCKPVRVLCRIGLGLLPLGLRDLAFNLEGDAVGAGNTEARGVASDLVSGEQLTTLTLTLTCASSIEYVAR